MMEIGRYIVFMISVMTTMSSPANLEEESLAQFIIHILNVHNNFRENHGVQLFVLDQKLCDDARDIWHKINNNQSNQIPNDVGRNEGHGVFNQMSDLNKEEAKRLISVWYDTGVGYDYENEPSKETALRTAPFTQIVWKNTKKIGLSIEVKVDSTYNVVVTYGPKGNKKKHYRRNVLKPKE